MQTEIDEVWVGIELLSNYLVSNFGRVVNVHTGRELKACPDSNGYMRVALYQRGIRHDAYVHRLVAKAFFLNYAEGIEVKHKSEHKQDNSVLNLTLGLGCRKGYDAKKAEREAVLKETRSESRSEQSGIDDIRRRTVPAGVEGDQAVGIETVSRRDILLERSKIESRFAPAQV